MAVGNSLLEKFSGKFRRCWKIPHRFSGSTKCYPCQGLGTFGQGKRLLENWARLRERCWISPPRPPQPSWVLLILGEGKNLQNSAKICVWAQVCPLRFVPLSAPRHVVCLNFCQKKLQRATTKAQNRRGTFSYFLALFHTCSHFSEFFRTFPPGLLLRIKGFYCLVQRDEKRIKDNKKKNAKPICTLVVARLSSSD